MSTPYTSITVNDLLNYILRSTGQKAQITIRNDLILKTKIQGWAPFPEWAKPKLQRFFTKLMNLDAQKHIPMILDAMLRAHPMKYYEPRDVLIRFEIDKLLRSATPFLLPLNPAEKHVPHYMVRRNRGDELLIVATVAATFELPDRDAMLQDLTECRSNLNFPLDAWYRPFIEPTTFFQSYDPHNRVFQKSSTPVTHYNVEMRNATGITEIAECALVAIIGGRTAQSADIFLILLPMEVVTLDNITISPTRPLVATINSFGLQILATIKPINTVEFNFDFHSVPSSAFVKTGLTSHLALLPCLWAIVFSYLYKEFMDNDVYKLPVPS